VGMAEPLHILWVIVQFSLIYTQTKIRYSLYTMTGLILLFFGLLLILVLIKENNIFIVN